VTLVLPCRLANAGAPPPPPPPPPSISGPGPSGANAANATGFLFGGHAGYNWQQGATVFGFETDLQSIQLNSSMSGGLMGSPLFPLTPLDTARTTGSVDWYGTFRGRVGYAAGPWLFYGTGGLAYGGVRLDSSFTAFGALGGLPTSAVASQVRAGWVGGAGVEYLLRPDLSLTFNYQFVDLGRLNLASTASALGPFTVSQTASTHAQFQAAMVGFSWHLPPSGSWLLPPAGGMAPWAGAYGGLQLGGAWGNDADARYSSTGTVFNISDVRLKRDITLLGRREDGLGIYSFKYLWSDKVYTGAMAQEVALIRPDAVARDPLSGYLAVNYSRLGPLGIALK
jgi:outer membrane immunogenic protein